MYIVPPEMLFIPSTVRHYICFKEVATKKANTEQKSDQLPSNLLCKTSTVLFHLQGMPGYAGSIIWDYQLLGEAGAWYWKLSCA